jgi:hypothetical protein
MIISYEKFVDDFEPYTNTMSDDRGYNNTMYETFSPEIDHVKAQNPEYIWTLIDGENNNSWIIPGFHIVDRIGYFICQIAWTNEDIIVNDNELINVNKCSKIGLDFIREHLNIHETSIKESFRLSQKAIAFYLAEYADDGGMHGNITTHDLESIITEYIEDTLKIEQDVFSDALADFISSPKVTDEIYNHTDPPFTTITIK